MWIKVKDEELIQQAQVIKAFCGLKSEDIVKAGINAYKETEEFKEKMKELKERLNI